MCSRKENKGDLYKSVRSNTLNGLTHRLTSYPPLYPHLDSLHSSLPYEGFREHQRYTAADEKTFSRSSRCHHRIVETYMISSFFLFNSSISARVMSRLSIEEISKSSFLANIVLGACMVVAVAMPLCWGDTKASTVARATTQRAKRERAGREIMMGWLA